MEKTRKRKRQVHINSNSNKKIPFRATKSTQPVNQDPYPTHQRPTPEECLAIRDQLLALHGFPEEFVKYRKQRLTDNAGADNDHGTMKSEPLVNDDVEESVLDGLIKTVLSQNTTEVNSLRAFASLKAAFPSWEAVLAAESKCIENSIRCGGLAPTKAACIKNILRSLLDKRGKICLEYLRDLSVDEIKAELSHFKGIGPKTVACVLMFHLQQDDFPVDTHVFEIAKAIGWVPVEADRSKTYLHLNRWIPKELKFDLNCLLFTHGKLCRKCTMKGLNKQRKESCDDFCPLLDFCSKSNMNISKKAN